MRVRESQRVAGRRDGEDLVAACCSRAERGVFDVEGAARAACVCCVAEERRISSRSRCERARELNRGVRHVVGNRLAGRVEAVAGGGAAAVGSVLVGLGRAAA